MGIFTISTGFHARFMNHQQLFHPNFFKRNTEVQSRFIQEKCLLFIHPQVEIPRTLPAWKMKIRGFEIPSFEVTFCGVTFAISNIERCQNRRKTLLLKRGERTTHLKFNIAPEMLPSQKESTLPTIIFQGLC